MNGRFRAELQTLHLRADESEARSGAHGWGQAGQSAKPTERSEACARAGVGLVGEADNKGSPQSRASSSALWASSSPPAGGEQLASINFAKPLTNAQNLSKIYIIPKGGI